MEQKKILKKILVVVFDGFALEKMSMACFGIVVHGEMRVRRDRPSFGSNE